MISFDRVLSDTSHDDLLAGRFNPEIFDLFIATLKERFPGDVLKVWELFAGHSEPVNRCQEKAHDLGVLLISYDLAPTDKRVMQADSTVTGPGELIHGIIFHPPYFGVGAFSDDPKDLGNLKVAEAYKERLAKTLKLGIDVLRFGGLVCAVGRRYRTGKKEIQLDQWFCDLMMHDLAITEWWSAMPDIAIIGEMMSTTTP